MTRLPLALVCLCLVGCQPTVVAPPVVAPQAAPQATPQAEALKVRQELTAAEANKLLPRIKVELVAVLDGDTITVTHKGEQHKVRLAYIDAPELKQPGGEDARKVLTEQIQIHPGTTEDGLYLRLVDTEDLHGRWVAEVWTGTARREAVCLNRLLMQKGWAWWYKAYRSEYLRDADYDVLQQTAADKELGLWTHGAQPVPPWEWRRSSHIAKLELAPIDP